MSDNIESESCVNNNDISLESNNNQVTISPSRKNKKGQVIDHII